MDKLAAWNEKGSSNSRGERMLIARFLCRRNNHGASLIFSVKLLQEIIELEQKRKLVKFKAFCIFSFPRTAWFEVKEREIGFHCLASFTTLKSM